MTALVADVLTSVAEVVAGVGFKQSKGYPPQDISPPCSYTVAEAGGIETFNSGTLRVGFSVYVLTGAQVDRTGYAAALRVVNAVGDDSVMYAVNSLNTTTGWNSITNVNVTCLSWRFLNLDEVEGLDAYGVVFSGTVIIQKETT